MSSTRHTPFPVRFRFLAYLGCVLTVFTPQAAWSWGFHPLITRIAVGLLPTWQLELIREGRKGLENRYCVFPDDSRAPDAAPYVLKFPVAQQISHHIPASLEHQATLFEAYLPRVIELLRKGKTDEALRYFGSAAHFLEDSSAPGHMAYGEARVPDDEPPMLQMDFFKRFLPNSPTLDSEMVHSRIDSCPMTEEWLCREVAGYRPRLLGHSLEEFTVNLIEAHARMNERSCRHVFPVMAALAADDNALFTTHLTACSADGARLVADTLHTVLCIAFSRFETPPPSELDLADRIPAKGTAFAWSDSNHQGRLLRNRSGSVYPAMSSPPKLGRHPLTLRTSDGVREFTKGFGVGWKTQYTFLVPQGQFKRFSVWAGNDAKIGSAGINTYEVLLDGKIAATTSRMAGPDAQAEKLEVPLGDSSRLTLRCVSDGPAKQTHGVWAEPKLTR